MTDVSDEVLMAHADGQLDAEESRKLKDLLAADPQLRARLQAFLGTGAQLAQVFARPMSEPVPSHLVDLVMKAAPRPQASAVAPRLSTKVAHGGVLAGLWRVLSSSPFGVPVPLAFGVALAGIAAIIVVPFSGLLEISPPQKQVIRGELAQALETAPSGTSRTLAGTDTGGAKVKLRLTFQSKADGYCRQYELEPQAGGLVVGIGCRGPGGVWTVKAQAQSLKSTGPAENRTAPAAANPRETIGSLIDSLSVGPVFEPAQEAPLLRNGWTPPAKP